MADSAVIRNRRARAHARGDHSMCTSRCAVARGAGLGSMPPSNGDPAEPGPIGAAVDAYVSSLNLGGSDAKNVMAQCCLKLAAAFDSAAGRDMPSVSRELRTSLSWLADAGGAEDQLAEIRSRRLKRRTESILAEVDRQRARDRSAGFGDEGA